jgi:hypothetical protein
MAPYIDVDRRNEIDRDGRHAVITGPGELNFVFTDAITDYLFDNGISYQSINDVLGALEGAKLEFYRRIAVPYEEKKLQENGDVYDG